ncbi:MAG: type 1 glutamine amidotransferase domain-containing protein [Acidimicrobiales bacterium]
MAQVLQGKKVAFLVANEGVEEVELAKPWEALVAQGAEAELVAPDTGEVQAFQHLDKGGTFTVDRTTKEVSVSDYDAIVLPGGVANPDQLRRDPNAVSLVRQFVESGKPVGVICHGPWTMVEAGVLQGRTLTSWPSLQTDIRNAGGTWVDEEVHVERGIVSSRMPSDLPAFSARLIEEIAEGRHSR